MSLVPGSGCSSLPSAFAMNSPISFGTGNTREKKICCGGACAATATHARRTKPTATRILMSSSPSPTLRDVFGGQKNTTVELAMHVRGLTHRLQPLAEPPHVNLCPDETADARVSGSRWWPWRHPGDGRTPERKLECDNEMLG